MKLDKNMKYTLAALVAVIALGGFLRLCDLGWETFSFDEVVYAYHAANEYTKGNFIYNFHGFDTPPLGKYMYALAVVAGGFSEVTSRLIPAVFGILSIIVAFFVARKLYSDKYTPIFAAVLVAFSIIHIQFSRLAVMESIVTPFFILSLYFMLELTEKREKKSYLFLGLAIGLGMLVKYVMIYAIISILIFALYKGVVRLRKKPDVSIAIDRNFIKAILVTIALFFLIWPMALYPIKTDIAVNIEHNGSHGGSVSASVPLVFLTFGNVGGSALAERTDIGTVKAKISEFHVFGYLVLFTVKENIIFVALFFAGLYAAAKRRKDFDKLLILSIAVFFVMLWFQKYGFTYRYITVLIPVMAIIAAGSLSIVRKDLHKKFLIIAVAVLMLAVAVQSHPSYAFHYNPVNSLAGIDDPEVYYSEGSKAVVEYSQHCDNVYTPYHYVIGPYVGSKLVNNTNPRPLCIFLGKVNTPGKAQLVEYAQTNCNLDRSVTKNNILLFDIYRCD